MYYAMRASAPSLHRESTDSLIIICVSMHAHVVWTCAPQTSNKNYLMWQDSSQQFCTTTLDS